KQICEKLRRIADLLGLNPHLVPGPGIELRQLLAALADFLEPAAQLLGSGLLDRSIAAVARMLIFRLAPLPSFQPRRDLERQPTDPRRSDGFPRTRERRRALLGQIAGKARTPRRTRMTPLHRGHDPRLEDMKLTRRRELPRQPLELSFELVRLLVAQNVA